jgi:NAD(P)H-nitrite reductase large subunit
MKNDNPEGAILQRDKKTYAIVPRTPVGILSAEILDKISAVVKKYHIPVVKITSGQRIALVGLEKDQVGPAWDDLQIEHGEAEALCLHYVQACPGNSVCKFGVDDSLGLGIEIEAMFQGLDYPAKLKFGVSGCPMCCGESYLRDVGVFAKNKGWTLIVGGNAGGRPRIGDVIAQDISRSRVLELSKKFLEYYKENARKKERTCRFIDRVGIDKVKKALDLE